MADSNDTSNTPTKTLKQRLKELENSLPRTPSTNTRQGLPGTPLRITFAQLQLRSLEVQKLTTPSPISSSASKKGTASSARKRKRTTGADSTGSPSRKPRNKKDGNGVVDEATKAKAEKTTVIQTPPLQPGGRNTGIHAFVTSNPRAARLIGPAAVLRQYRLMAGFTIPNAPMTLAEMRSLGNFEHGLTPDGVRLIDDYLRHRLATATTATVQPQPPVPTPSSTTTNTRAQRIFAELSKLQQSDFNSRNEHNILLHHFKRWKMAERNKIVAAKLLDCIRNAYAAAVSRGDMAAVMRLQTVEKTIEMELEEILKK